jgi:hypothetical protein
VRPFDAFGFTSPIPHWLNVVFCPLAVGTPTCAALRLKNAPTAKDLMRQAVLSGDYDPTRKAVFFAELKEGEIAAQIILAERTAKAYPHAACYLRRLGTLAKKIRAWSPIAPHESCLQTLWAEELTECPTRFYPYWRQSLPRYPAHASPHIDDLQTRPSTR